jgi:hypothetical protein
VRHRCRYQWTESLGKSHWDRMLHHQLQECKQGHISYQTQKMPESPEQISQQIHSNDKQTDQSSCNFRKKN